VLSGEIGEGDTVLVDAEGDEIVLGVRRQAPAEAAV
jgi:hypothetical protein